MCGRYASSRRPEDLVEEFEVADDRVARAAGARLQRRAHQGGVRRRRAAAVARTSPTSRRRAAAAGAALGAGAVVGQGPVDRQPDDQRPDGDGGREAGVPAGVREAAVPAAGRRLLRVVPHRSRLTKAGKPRKQPFFIRPEDGGVLAMAGLYEIWRDPTRDEDDPDRFRWTCTVLTTEAEDALGHIHDRMPLMVERGPLGRRGSTPTRRPGRPARPAGARPPRAGWRPTRSPRWSATCATTAPSCVEPLPLGGRPCMSAATRSAIRRHAARRGPAASPTAPGARSRPCCSSHGAGGGIDARDLEALAAALPAPGVTVVLLRAAVAGRRPQGRHPAGDARRRPAWPPPTSCGCARRWWSAAARAGARSAARCARHLGAAGCLALSFPLHPPGPAGEVAGSTSCAAPGADPGDPGRARPDGPARGVPATGRRPGRRARRPTTGSRCPARGAGHPGRGAGDRRRGHAGVDGPRGRRAIGPVAAVSTSSVDCPARLRCSAACSATLERARPSHAAVGWDDDD